MTTHDIYFGDCIEILDNISNKSVHLVVTSPPYYNARKDVAEFKDYSEYLDYMQNRIKKLKDVLINGGIFCLNSTSFTKNKKMYPIPFDLLEISKKIGFELIWDVIWLKPKSTQGLWRSSNYNYKNPYPFKPYFNCFHEYIWIMKKTGERKISEEKLKNSKIHSREKMLKYSYREWYFPVAKPSKEKHTSSYPLDLPNYCIELFSLKGDTILDPFLGTGTSIKAAIELDRNSIGIERKKSIIN